MGRIESISDLTSKKVTFERTIDDFTNMDLSGVDLSSFDPSFWEDAIFHNTNFASTGIRFNQRLLKHRSVVGCNFENVDLSYIDEDCWNTTNISGANFRNTGINIDFRATCRWNNENLGNIQLDEKFAEKAPEYWDECKISFETLRANPFMKVTSYKLFSLIKEFLRSKYAFVTKEKAALLVEECEKILTEFDNGEVARMYEIFCANADDIDKLSFFMGKVQNKRFGRIEISGLPLKLLGMISFYKCTFKEIQFGNSMEELTSCDFSLFNSKWNGNKFGSIKLTDLGLDSWRDIKYTRIGQSGSLTFKKVLYVEIGNACNCKCAFCRNQSFDETSRNLEKIVESIDAMKEYMDEIFIGGGEPSLYYEDILNIRKNIRRNVVIVTNGTLTEQMIDSSQSIARNLGVYVSRHSMSDDENRRILNVAPSQEILTMNDIESINRKTDVTLSPVCVQGGLDSSFKIINYIANAFERGIRRILISTLHKDASMGHNRLYYHNLEVSEDVFDDVYAELIHQGFEEKENICSTGGYVLKRFAKDGYVVAFKLYITKEQFWHFWNNSIKRTFDFTITAAGEIYSDWCRGKAIDLSKM